MSSIDDLFNKPHLPSSHAGGKRKLEAADAQEIYKAAKHSANGDAKGKTNGSAHVEDEEDDEEEEAGPELPPEDEDEDAAADEEGRFFGGGVTRDTTDALDYLEETEDVQYIIEDIDAAWMRRLVTTFERRINKNAELRAKFETEPQKFMASEAALDAEIKGLSIVSEHPELYIEFVKADGASLLVGLLAHENTDIAINAIEIISELIDEDVKTTQEQWDTMVDAMLNLDLLSLLVQNFERFDELNNESDRQGVYHALAVIESLASQISVAEKTGNDGVLGYLLRRIQVKERPISQNKQYAVEVLQVLLQQPSVVRERMSKLGGVDTILQLLSAYRKRDPEKGSYEEEYFEGLFDSLACVVDDPEGKHAFVEGEGVELMLIMLREGKLSKVRALTVLDHATNGQAREVCEKIVEAAGLKHLFSLFMKKDDKTTIEHLLGIFAATLRLLPGESEARIRTLSKFVEKDYEKISKMTKLRREYGSRLAVVDQQITTERSTLSDEEIEEQGDEWFLRRLDAGLYSVRMLDVILTWLVAEDQGAKRHIVKELAEQDETLDSLRASLEEQLRDIDGGQDQEAAEMLTALIDCLE